jgi:hypothetical protein
MHFLISCLPDFKNDSTNLLRLFEIRKAGREEVSSGVVPSVETAAQSAVIESFRLR